MCSEAAQLWEGIRLALRRELALLERWTILARQGTESDLLDHARHVAHEARQAAQTALELHYQLHHCDLAPAVPCPHPDCVCAQVSDRGP